MIDVKIERAGLSELDTLMKWRMEVLREVFDPLPEIEVPRLEIENRRYYESALADGSHIACFAWLDGKIIGCGGMCLQQEMPSPDNINGQCAYLMNIYVVKPYRHLRIGHDIVKWLVAEANKLSISKIYLETSKAGRNLYESMGFVDMEDMMKLKHDIS